MLLLLLLLRTLTLAIPLPPLTHSLILILTLILTLTLTLILTLLTLTLNLPPLFLSSSSSALPINIADPNQIKTGVGDRKRILSESQSRLKDRSGLWVQDEAVACALPTTIHLSLRTL